MQGFKCSLVALCGGLRRVCPSRRASWPLIQLPPSTHTLSNFDFFLLCYLPQVYERAGCLVGVYSRRGASHAVTLHLSDGKEG